MCPFSIDLSKKSASKGRGEKKKDTPTINFIGQLSNLILGKLIVPKYLDLGIPLVNVHINKTFIHNTLIDLGASISVMTKYTILKLNLQGFLRDTPTILQLAEKSAVKPEGMLEYMIIFIDYWEYPTKFLVLQTKYKFNGYPLIFGMPWMATIYSYIDYRARNKTIIDGLSKRNIGIYPPTQTLITKNLPMLIEEEE
jgi:hypothetical protein